MITPLTPYRFYEVWVPKRAPYSDPSTQWASILGEWVLPIVIKHGGDMTWWCVREGRWIQFCFASENPAPIETTIRSVCKAKRFTVKRVLRTGTAGGALGGERWCAPDLIGTLAERQRSVMLLRLMNEVCSLQLHSLTKRGKVWGVERNKDRQNPHGNLFESLMHLIANVTGAQFHVHLMARTVWTDWAPAKVTLHL